MTSPAPSSSSSRAAYGFIFFAVMLDMLALGIISPVLPRLIVGFEGGNYARAATIAGVFGFAGAGMQFLFQPVLGALSDRFGRRPVMILSNLGLGLDYLLMAVAPSLLWIFAGRILSGILAASSATAMAYVADTTPMAERARKFGLLGAAWGIGFIVGPALGGVLGDMDLRLPFWVAAALGLLNGVYGLLVLPESLPADQRTPFRWRTSHPFGALQFLRKDAVLRGLALSVFIQRAALMPSLLVLYTDYRYGWDATAVGWFMAAIGFASVVVSGGMIGPIVKLWGERATAIGAMMIGIVGFVIYGWAPNSEWILIGLPLLALWGLAVPAMQALMSARVEASEQGQLQGALASLQGFGGLIGPVIATQAFAWGISTVNVPGLPYFITAVLVGIALIVALRVTRRANA